MRVLKRQLEEQLLCHLAPSELLDDRGVIAGAVLESAIEDRRVREEPGYRQLLNVALQRSTLQQVASDVVKPETLPKLRSISAAFMCEASNRFPFREL